MRGKEVDIEALSTKNATMPAVSNAKINARGDYLGPNGEIIQKREDVINAYYDTNPKSKANQK
jgi:hypothetical protein